MKKGLFRTFSVIILVIVLMTAFAGSVLAADPPDVDVDIGIGTPGDVDVDIDINAGGDVSIDVNGAPMASMQDVQNAKGVGTVADLFTYQASRACWKWINEQGGPGLNFVTNGLSNVITAIGDPSGFHSTISDTVGDIDSDLDRLNNVMAGHGSELNNLNTMTINLKDGQERLFIWSGEFVQWVEAEQTANLERDNALNAALLDLQTENERQKQDIQALWYNQTIMFYVIIGLGVIAIAGAIASVILSFKLRSRRA